MMNQDEEKLTPMELRIASLGYVCPFSLEIMTDPVVAEDGNSYEKIAIEAYFFSCQQKEITILSPLTGLPMGSGLIRNRNLKASIEEFKKTSKQEYEEQDRRLADARQNHNFEVINGIRIVTGIAVGGAGLGGILGILSYGAASAIVGNAVSVALPVAIAAAEAELAAAGTALTAAQVAAENTAVTTAATTGGSLVTTGMFGVAATGAAAGAGIGLFAGLFTAHSVYNDKKKNREEIDKLRLNNQRMVQAIFGNNQEKPAESAKNGQLKS